MTNDTYNFHGSDLESIERKYQIKKESIVNFSANVNPIGISPKLRDELSCHIDLISSYPDREYTLLKQNISAYVGTVSKNIIVGNGSTELISLFISILNPKKALIIGPTYSEYEREIFLNGGSSHYYRLKEELDFKIELHDLQNDLTDDTDLLVICNPNNPTSTAIYRDELRIILDYCKEKDICVMIDETYVEFAEEIDKITAVPLTEYYNNLIILRGISKFYAAPGLRLGYGVCGNSELNSKINSIQNPWTINSLASFSGEVMFSDTEYIKKTKELINSERTKIFNELSTWDTIKIFQPKANFVLIKILRNDIDSHELFIKLIKKRIMIRDASTFPFLNSQYFRFCFMLPEHNDMLLSELKKLL